MFRGSRRLPRVAGSSFIGDGVSVLLAILLGSDVSGVFPPEEESISAAMLLMAESAPCEACCTGSIWLPAAAVPLLFACMSRAITLAAGFGCGYSASNCAGDIFSVG